MFYFLIFVNTLFLILLINLAVKQIRRRYTYSAEYISHQDEGRIINFFTREIKTQIKPTINY